AHDFGALGELSSPPSPTQWLDRRAGGIRRWLAARYASDQRDRRLDPGSCPISASRAGRACDPLRAGERRGVLLGRAPGAGPALGPSEIGDRLVARIEPTT